jgi:K+-transporting ATPase A subunit
MEGKEVRFGIANPALFATVTTDASCGAVNSMHDSFTPLGGMVPMVNILLGEVVFGAGEQNVSAISFGVFDAPPPRPEQSCDRGRSRPDST